jgi:uncharacterized repeat protein (TIGR01451 family)
VVLVALAPSLQALSFGAGFAPPGSTQDHANRERRMVVTTGEETQTGDSPDIVRTARAREIYSRLPMSFEPNRGQADPTIRFLTRGPGYTLSFADGEVAFTASQIGHDAKTEQEDMPETQTPQMGPLLRMRFVGSNPTPQLGGEEELSGKVNYIIGSDPYRWRTNIPTYAGVRYKGLYTGIDLVFHGSEGQLEYDFIVAPGADPRVITLAFVGAERAEVDAAGNLLLHVAGRQIRQLKPLIYQEVAGVRQKITGGYVLADRQQVEFRLGPYDVTRPLVIDPVVLYSTFLGGEGYDAGLAVGADGASNAYVTGFTSSVGFSTTAGAFQTAKAEGIDAFVTKINAAGSALVYSTYIGGSSDEWGSGIALDTSGNAYVTGRTDSTNFPTTSGAFRRSFSGGVDAFVLKLNATGSALAYSTYLGGSGFEHDRDNILIVRAAAIDVDDSGNAYVTGQTTSADFPTVNAIQPNHGGGFCPAGNLVCSDVYVTKLNSAGTGLVYSTFLGGNDEDTGSAIFVDASGSAYVAGSAFPGFPTTPGAFQSSSQGFEAFVSKVNASGSALFFSTFLGGELSDTATGVAADASGNTYVTGSTTSFQFPTTSGAFQTSKIGNEYEAFVTKLNTTGSALVYSTYLGERETDEAVGIAVDGAGNAHIAGHSELGTPFGCPFANFDVFVASLNAGGSGLIFTTCLGGFRDDFASGMALDAGGNLYVTGRTASSGEFFHAAFPTTPGAFQGTFAGGATDAFVAKVGASADLALTKTGPPGRVPAGRNMTYTLTVANHGPDAASGVTVIDVLPPRVTFVSATSTQGTCGESGGIVTCNLGTMGSGDTATIDIVVNPTSAGTITNTASVSASTSDPNGGNNTDSHNASVCRITSRRSSIPCG